MTTSGGTAKDKPGKRTPPRRPRQPFDAKEKARILDEARKAAGAVPQVSLTATAKRLGVSRGTLSEWCKAAEPPITWDRTATAAAVEARTTDLKALRAQIAEGLLHDAVRMREMMFTPQQRTHFSVTLGERHYETPPSAGELRDLLVATGIALDKHLVLVRADTDDRDLPAVDAWLEHMMGDDSEDEAS